MNESVVEALALLVNESVWVKAPYNDDGIIFLAKVEAQDLAPQLNDFPQEQLFTLLSGGKPLLSFDDWPIQFGAKPWIDHPRIA